MVLLTLGALLNFVVDPESVPVVGLGRFSYQLRILRALRPRSQRPARRAVPAATRLRPSLPAEMNEGGVGVRDMLDVQILLCLSTLWFARYSQDALWRFDPPESPAQRTGGDDLARSDRPPMPYLAVCACLGYDAPYLHEWIEFHRLVGVERFFLYNNGDRETQRELLAPYIEEGVVVLHDWTVFPPQTPAYNHLLEEHREDARWVAVIDTDEFLFSSTGQPLPEVLADYEESPGVGVNRLTFGTSGHRTKPEGLVTENYLGSFDARGASAHEEHHRPHAHGGVPGPPSLPLRGRESGGRREPLPDTGRNDGVHVVLTPADQPLLHEVGGRVPGEAGQAAAGQRRAVPGRAMWQEFATTFQDGWDVPDETILRYVPRLKQRLAAIASPLIRSST